MSAWLLHNRFTLEVSRPSADVLNRIRRRVVSRGAGMVFPVEDPLFSGRVGDDGFCLYRHAGYKSAFEPVVWGKVTPTAAGSRIEVYLRSNGGGIGCLSLWVAVIVGMTATSFFQMEPAGQARAGPMALFGLIVMPAPVYLTAVWTVWYETRKTRAVLTELLA